MTIEHEVDEAVERILGARADSEARQELRSHLLDSAHAHGGISEAVRAAGGDAKLAQAFGSERFPTTRGRRVALGSVLGVRAFGALLGLAACIYAVTRSQHASW